MSVDLKKQHLNVFFLRLYYRSFPSLTATLAWGEEVLGLHSDRGVPPTNFERGPFLGKKLVENVSNSRIMSRYPRNPAAL